MAICIMNKIFPTKAILLTLYSLILFNSNVSAEVLSPTNITSPDGHWRLLRLSADPLEKTWSNEEINPNLFIPNIVYQLIYTKNNFHEWTGIDFQGGAGSPPQVIWSPDSRFCAIIERPDRGIVKIITVVPNGISCSSQVFQPSDTIRSLVEKNKGNQAYHEPIIVFFKNNFHWKGTNLLIGTVQGGQGSDEWTIEVNILFSNKPIMKILNKVENP